MSEIIFIALLIAVPVLGIFMIPRLLLNRAIYSVIKTFRDNNAKTHERAKTMAELSLTAKPIIERFSRLRDYKPYAIKILIGADIIQATEDGKFYLSEEKLAASKWSAI